MSKNTREWRVDFGSEIDTRQFIKELTKPVILLIICLLTIIIKSFWVAVGYILFIVLINFIFYILSRKDAFYSSKDKSELCTKEIKATITNIKYDYDAYKDYYQIFCVYRSLDGKQRKFKSNKKIGKINKKKGDTINVLIEPGNYSNYIILEDSIDG